MAKHYKFKDGQEGIPDTQKIVEESETVDVTTTYTVHDLQVRVDTLNIELALKTTERDTVLAQLNAAKAALGIS